MAPEEILAETYKEVSEIPQVKRGRILEAETLPDCGNLTLQIESECRDLVSMKQQRCATHYFVNGSKVSAFPSVPLPCDVVLREISPRGDKVAQIIQSEVESKLLINESDGTIKVIDLKSKNMHGKVFCDPYISSLDWSHDERRVVFIAEQKEPVLSTFYSPGVDKEGVSEKYRYVDDWGEQMTGQHQGVIVIVDIITESIKILQLPDDLTPGHLVWRPNSEAVIGVGYVSKPFRIGIAYCSDRESVLFQMSTDGIYEELTRRGEHVKSPRFSPSGDQLVYLQSDMYGPRAPTARLMLMKWPSKQAEVILDYVSESTLTRNQENFYGVCGKTILPKRCFSTSEKGIWFSAFYWSNCVIYYLNLVSKEITDAKESRGYDVILDTYNDWLLILTSSVTQPDRVFITKFKGEEEREGGVGYLDDLLPITKESILSDMDEINWDLWGIRSPIPDKEGNCLTPSILYIGPTQSKEGDINPRPLICWPHGGPHSIIANRFNHVLTFFVKCGYSVLLPNYRGSIGHGGNFFTSSLGQCGEADVEDCFQAVKECLRRFSKVLNHDKIFLIGHSHGGFLALHLAAKYPGFFSGLAALNPASDIYIMATVSDIPEWAYLEYGLPFKLGRNVDEDSVVRMFRRSPISLVDEVKVPTLFILGRDDLRVPPQQGLNFYRMLLARNIPTKVYMYEDDHPLLKISSESDYVVQVIKWFQNNCTH